MNKGNYCAVTAQYINPKSFRFTSKKAKLGIPVSKFGGVHLEHSCHQTIGHDLGNFRGFLNSWLSEQNDDFNLEASLALENSRS